MIKSAERVVIEEGIRAAHEESVSAADRLAQEKEWGKSWQDIDETKLDEDELRTRIELVHQVMKEPWQRYVKGQKKLLELETKEDFPAFRAYAEHIDMVGNNLPTLNKVVCYHPFSGLDFLWARIFRHLINEDISFGQEHLYEWWKGDYNPQKRKEIVALLKRAGLIPQAVIVEFIKGDAYVDNERTKELNNFGTTLLIKRGCDVLEFLERRYLNLNRPIMFGAILLASGYYSHKKEEVKETLFQYGYNLTSECGTHDEDFEHSVPYALGPCRVDIFTKKP